VHCLVVDTRESFKRTVTEKELLQKLTSITGDLVYLTDSRMFRLIEKIYASVEVVAG